jgi:hypothetical protein
MKCHASVAVAATFRLGWTGSGRHPSARQFALTVCEGAIGVESFSVIVCVLDANALMLSLGRLLLDCAC